MKRTRRNLFILVAFLIGISGIYNLPPVQERLGRRVAELMERVKYALLPLGQIVFVSEESGLLATPMPTSRLSRLFLSLTRSHASLPPLPRWNHPQEA